MKIIKDFLAPHTKGESLYVDDLPEPSNLLHAFVFTSTIPHGKIVKLNLEKAEKSPGVNKILTSKDIPGENQLGRIIQDEVLLAEDEVEFVGQPIAIILAETKEQAKKASKLIEIEYEKLPAVFDPREAAEKGLFIASSNTLSNGDVDAAWEKCDVIIEGTVENGGQEHVYLETQAALAIPDENDKILIYSSTQAPTTVQGTTAKILGLDMNMIEVDVKRIGGGFGGKEDQATQWAAICALGAFHTKRPVKLILNRKEDIQMTGKRHPYTSDYKIGLTKEGKIIAFEASIYQNSGASADLSTAILSRTLFHSNNSYFIPNVKVTGYPCKTNLPPFTAFRGFGGPQGMFLIESAIDKAAEVMGLPKHVLQEKNLLEEGDEFHYGQKVERSNARRSFEELLKETNFKQQKKEIEEFNQSNKYMKKGLSIMPICFGISFTSTFLNQAGALVNIYKDGSVSVSTGAIEMGQGVNVKIRHIVSLALGIDPERIRIESTNTTRVINTSPTAASTGADLNGKAAEIACNRLVERLKKVASEKIQVQPEKIEIKDDYVCVKGKKTELGWNELINSAYMSRVNLSSQALYATPKIFFNKGRNKGKPFAYHVFGAALTEVTIDCIRGTYSIDKVTIVHDAGKSINYLVDLGQTEGGLLQGIGWMTIEQLMYKEGHILTDSFATYKIPNLPFTPEIKVKFLENAENPEAVLKSKAIGEPPFMYGIGAYFALKNAARAFRKDKDWNYSAPLTPEKLLLYLYENES